MDFPYRIFGSRRIPTLSIGIRELPKSLNRLRVTNILKSPSCRPVIGGLLVLFGLGLAHWAHQLTGRDALAEWKKLNPPSEMIWNTTLKSKGFQLIQDSSKLHQALRVLPVALDQQQSIWISEEGSWIALFRKTQEEPIVHALPNNKPPQKWLLAGSSWDGFQTLFEKLEKAEKTRKFEANKQSHGQKTRNKQSKTIKDPYEIRY